MSVTMIMTSAEMQAEGGREKWLELRKNGIGGSDAGVIVGVNPWKNRFQLWMEKTGQAGEQELTEEQIERMDWGTRMEPVIADWFEAKTGKKLRRCGMIRNNEYPFMFADVDRLVVGENAIVEIKTTSAFNKDEWADDKLPDSYYCQIQHYMAVGGYDKCYVVCLLGGQKAVIREVARNDEDIAVLIEEEGKFWNDFVVTKTIPEVDASNNCKKLIEKLYPGGEKEVLQIGGEWEAVCEEIEQMKAQIKQLENFIKEKENKLRLQLGNYEKGECGDYTITFGKITRKSFDSKGFGIDYPNLVNTYTRVSEFRTLKVNLKKAAKKRRAKEMEEEA